jgi:hypothetical protein
MNPNTTTIDPTNLVRLQLQERIATASGFSLPAPLFALGTPVVDLGVENFRKSRSEFESLPPAADVFGRFVDRIAAERRKDVAVTVAEIRMNADGSLMRSYGGKTLLLDGARSLRGLLDRTPCEEPGAAATYLATVPSGRRAGEVNEWLRAADPAATMVLRTRLALAQVDAEIKEGRATLDAYGREVFAVVSEKYGTGLEVDVLARKLELAAAGGFFPGDARAEILYDGRAATIRALWHSNVDPKAACAGEVFKAGVGIRAADDRSEGIEVLANLWRNLCLNFIVIGTANRSFGKRRHVGGTADLVEWLTGALAEAAKSVTGFADLWDAGRAKRLDDPTVTRDIPAALPYGKADEAIVAGIFRDLMRRNVVALPGSRGEDAVTKYVGSWRKEPEFNKVGIVNAVTRAAHEVEMTRAFASDDLEAAGGKILASPRPFSYVEKGDVF